MNQFNGFLDRTWTDGVKERLHVLQDRPDGQVLFRNIPVRVKPAFVTGEIVPMRTLRSFEKLERLPAYWRGRALGRLVMTNAMDLSHDHLTDHQKIAEFETRAQDAEKDIHMGAKK